MNYQQEWLNRKKGDKIGIVANDDQLKAELEELVAVMCKALNDPKRLLILNLIAEGPRSVGELVRLIGSPQANVSQHLAVLRDRGIIEASKQGTAVKYSLRYPQLLSAINILREVMREEVRRRGDVIVSPDAAAS